MGGNEPGTEVPRETRDAVDWYFGEQRDRVERYAAALGSSGVERGLIGPREIPRLWERHLLNCVAIVELLDDDVRLVDVGSGAGLPGMVVALARPDVSVTLLEPLLRRVTWLGEVVNELGLENVTIVRARAEEPAVAERPFDVATARAVAPLDLLASWSLPLVRPGGELLALKGASAAEELAGSVDSLRKHGAESWSLVSCGEGVLEAPTTVVRVVRSSMGKSPIRGTGGGSRSLPRRARAGTRRRR